MVMKAYETAWEKLAGKVASRVDGVHALFAWAHELDPGIEETANCRWSPSWVMDLEGACKGISFRAGNVLRTCGKCVIE